MRAKILSMISAIAVFSFCALADDGHGNNGNNNNNGNSSFQSSVIGSVPGLAIGGVGSGPAPWVVTRGEASISGNGRIQVEVQGLLIGPGGPPNLVGTVGPVTMVAATLVCGGSGGTPVVVADLAITPSPLSVRGDAEINQIVTLPSPCFAPVVLVRIFTPSAPSGSQLGPFIAVTGLTPGAAQNQNEDNGQGRGH